MDGFDRRLRARLERLEAAMPKPTDPVVPARRTATWRRAGIGLVLAVVALGTVAAAIALSSPDPRVAAADEARRAREEAAFLEAYDARSHPDCPTIAQARAEATAILQELGLDWTIRDDGRDRDAPCVGMAPSADVKEVWLMPSMGRVVAEGLDRLKEEMTQDCQSRDEAVETVASFLRSAGIPDPDVRVGGFIVMPIDGRRLVQGCYVYAAAQFDEHGRYTWYVAGPGTS